MRTLTLLLAVGTLALVGCKGWHPVGPLARQQPITQQSKPMTKEAATTGTASRAARPAPPTALVKPEDVTADNAQAMAAKFAAELEADSKAAASAPVTVEVSHVQGRR